MPLAHFDDFFSETSLPPAYSLSVTATKCRAIHVLLKTSDYLGTVVQTNDVVSQ